MAERKSILLRLDPAVHDALARWAADELRSHPNMSPRRARPRNDDPDGA